MQRHEADALVRHISRQDFFVLINLSFCLISLLERVPHTLETYLYN